MGMREWLSRKTGMIMWRGTPSKIVYETVRPRPRGTQVLHHDHEKVVCSFRAAVRFWWMLPPVLVIMFFLMILPLAGGLSFFAGPIGPFAGLVVVIGFLFLIWRSVRWAYPKVEVTATTDYVRVGPYYFDRSRYGGISIGYQISYQGTTHGSGSGLPIVWKGLRLSYGPWGEELPYMIPEYHSTAIAIWLDAIIGSVQEKTTRSTADSGVREQKFES